MDNLLTVKRMLELEEMAKTSDIKYPLSLKEWRYIERAEKLPCSKMVDIINYFRNRIVINQYKDIQKILIEYNLSEKEFYQRFEDVERIMNYQESINNKLLKEQKRMVKKMNRY